MLKALLRLIHGFGIYLAGDSITPGKSRDPSIHPSDGFLISLPPPPPPKSTIPPDTRSGLAGNEGSIFVRIVYIYRYRCG